MKKVFSLICMAILALSFVACSDDDNVGAAYQRASTISVVKSDVLFSATAGTGSVEVKTDGPITLSKTSDWCQATLTDEPGKIQVAVDDNMTINGRSCILTIKSAEDSVNVTIQQQGFAFQIESDSKEVQLTSDDAQHLSYGLICNAKPSVSTNVDWLSAEMTADSLIINVEANETGHLREGYVKYEYGDMKDSIRVGQYDFDRDIAGDYRLRFTYDNGKNWYNVRAKFYQEDGEYFLQFPSYNWKLPVTFDSKACQLRVTGGHQVGTYTSGGTTTYVFSGTYTTGGAYYNQAYGAMVAAFTYDEAKRTCATFVDDGSFVYGVRYWAFYHFKTPVASSANDNRVGALFQFDGNSYLQKEQ